MSRNEMVIFVRSIAAGTCLACLFIALLTQSTTTALAAIGAAVLANIRTE